VVSSVFGEKGVNLSVFRHSGLFVLFRNRQIFGVLGGVFRRFLQKTSRFEKNKAHGS